mmetsp:Transcript_4989/g.12215  ORF Transcript_4989/g.12215 Transcript_4989/m.12215 type:complete len:295 (-) Transcript_4989:296-1180(-)
MRQHILGGQTAQLNIRFALDALHFLIQFFRRIHKSPNVHNATQSILADDFLLFLRNWLFRRLGPAVKGPAKNKRIQQNWNNKRHHRQEKGGASEQGVFQNIVGQFVVSKAFVLQNSQVGENGHTGGNHPRATIELGHFPKSHTASYRDRVLVRGAANVGPREHVIHGSQKEKSDRCDSIKEELKGQAVTQIDTDNVQRSTALFAVLRKEQLVVDKVHAQQGNDKRCIAQNIKGDNVQDNNSRRRKAVNGLNVAFTVENSRNGSNRKDNNVGSTGSIGAQIGCQKDLVVARDITP